jgi:hypothetical protein
MRGREITVVKVAKLFCLAYSPFLFTFTFNETPGQPEVS